MKIWYSAATDVTGKKLAEALGIEGGTKKPAGNEPIICWGTKINKNIDLGGRKVYNDPNKIRVNRNKLAALKLMSDKNVNVAPFQEVPDNKQLPNNITFPVVARTKFHQGGAGFWFCVNRMQLNKAVEEGAAYYQQYINIKTEYRLHVVGGKVIYAVRKTPRDNLKEAFIAHYTDYIKNAAEKKEDVAIDDATLKFTLDKLSKKFAAQVDMIIRSNTRGWKFVSVNTAQLKAEVKTQAVKAVEALGLDFGAVDCCVDDKGKVWIIEVNTGPGLEGKAFDAWVKALKDLTAAKAAVKKAKGVLKEKAAMLAKLLNAAENDEEIELLHKMWNKIKD